MLNRRTILAVFLAEGHVLVEGITDLVACNFVGMRFAHAESQPKDGLCDGLMLSENGVISFSTEHSNLKAEAARNIMTEHLAEMAFRFRKASDLTDDWIDPLRADFDSLEAGNAVDDLASYHANLAASSARLWHLASRDWNAWEEALQGSSIWTTVMTDHARALDDIISKSLESPFWSQKHRAVVASSLYYLFDVCALHKPYAVWLTARVCRDAAKARFLLRGGSPLFRSFESRESRYGIPRINWNHWIARAEANLEEAAPQLVPWLLTWADWPAPVTLADRALPRVLSAIACRNPIAILSAVSDADIELKAGVNLVHLCASAGAKGGAKSVRDFLLNKLPEGAFWLPAPMDKPIAKHLIEESWNIRMEVHGNLSERRKGGLIHAALKRLIREERPLTTVAGGKIFRDPNFPQCLGIRRTFGVAVGLSIRYGEKLDELDLLPAFAKLLHPRIWASTSRRYVNELGRELGMNEAAVDRFHNSVKEAVSGINDALGPGGAALYNESEWLMLFSKMF